jgi:hypothetical protein
LFEVLVIQLNDNTVDSTIIDKKIGAATKHANWHAVIGAPGDEFNQR